MSCCFTKNELSEAIRTLNSSISKCEKAKTKLNASSSQYKWVNRQLDALYLSVKLIARELEEQDNSIGEYSLLKLSEAAETIKHLSLKMEEMLERFMDKSPQRTLAIKRKQAFSSVLYLIDREIQSISK